MARYPEALCTAVVPTAFKRQLTQIISTKYAVDNCSISLLYVKQLPIRIRFFLLTSISEALERISENIPRKTYLYFMLTLIRRER